MKNSADPDQLASSEANWYGSTLFTKAGYIRAQQDKGWEFWCHIQGNFSAQPMELLRWGNSSEYSYDMFWCKKTTT